MISLTSFVTFATFLPLLSLDDNRATLRWTSAKGIPLFLHSYLYSMCGLSCKYESFWNNGIVWHGHPIVWGALGGLGWHEFPVCKMSWPYLDRVASSNRCSRHFFFIDCRMILSKLWRRQMIRRIPLYLQIIQYHLVYNDLIVAIFSTFVDHSLDKINGSWIGMKPCHASANYKSPCFKDIERIIRFVGMNYIMCLKVCQGNVSVKDIVHISQNNAVALLQLV